MYVSVPQVVKLVKQRVKCEVDEVALNSICLLDALMHSCGEPFRAQVVQKVRKLLRVMLACRCDAAV